MKQCTVLMGLLGLMFVSTVAAQNQQKKPTPYPDKNDSQAWPGVGPIRVFQWMVDNRNYYWTRRQADQNKIVLVGDSLIGGWRKHLKTYFPQGGIANRGIGGDVTRGTLFRLKEDVLDLNPKAIVLCVGTNDLSAHANPSGVADNIAAIIKQATDHQAQMPIILCNIPPRNHPKAPTKPGAVSDLNARIKKLADENEHVTLLDLFAAFAKSDGMPDPQYFGKDQLHIATKGYEKWAELLKEKITLLELDQNASKPKSQASANQPIKDYRAGKNWIDPATETLASQQGSHQQIAFTVPMAQRVPDGYQLTFSDEFNGKVVDKTKWFHRYIYDNARLDHLNDEVGRRVDSALSIKDQALTITATPRKDKLWNTGLCRSKWTFKYGYIEAAVKFPANRGAWPSFWLNSGVQYPNGKFSRLNWPPEIDIFELVNNGREGPFTITSFAHGKKAKGETTFTLLDKWGSYKPGYSFADGKWHVITCHWTPTDSTTWVDGVKIVSRQFQWLYNDGDQAVPAHILLDMAIGGEWPGMPQTKDPMVLQFDYVRVYQTPDQMAASATAMP
ncbi:MAG TPA: hypothetical protein DCM28_09815 [Phycisphaerales bacterium]|nr:hypothetical protein [Phycisphaerales bacterium]HCD32606.1 hypothetical protein [Phycisphaerales bacterium]